MEDMIEKLLKAAWHDDLGNTLVFADKGIPQMGIELEEGNVIMSVDGMSCCEGVITQIEPEKEKIITALEKMGYGKMAEEFAKSFGT